MAYDKNQKENSPINSNNKSSADFLPKYFRTPVNTKFLHSTVDQLISEGQTEKVSAYYGRKNAKAFKDGDPYLPEVSDDRQNYKLEAAITAFDTLGNNIFHKDYIDYINSVKARGGNTSNHSQLNAQEYYAWNPQIDWDKFYNFREYYWLPYGPLTVSVTGQQRNVVSTYSVTLDTSQINYAYIFSPDGLTKNPALKLYRGQTYKFNLDVEGMPFTIRTSVLEGDEYLYNTGVDKQKIEQGTITFTVPDTAPNVLFYQSTNDINAYGEFRIFDIAENSLIDVEKDVLGKKEYTLPNGYSLSNGMKVNFRGEVTPASFKEDEYYVDGVGSAINLIKASEVEITADYTTEYPVPFDSQNFDRVGFGTATSFAVTKDYVVISRSSSDRNPWSRYNRWVHREVVENSARINGIETTVDQTSRARRPIIEFNAGLKLFKFGTKSKANINLIDNTTTDIFSKIEGSTGHYVDGVELIDGMRVLFTADTSSDANNRIYKIKFIDFYDGEETTRQISLVKEADGDPSLNDVLFVTQGTKNAGKSFYYNGTSWLEGQKKNSVNQSPLFELFDDNGVSFSDPLVYPSSNFTGNKIFSYQQGEGTNDSELDFPLSYQNVENVGDILFDFDLLKETYNYQTDTSNTITSDKGFLRKYKDQDNFTVVNGWTKAKTESKQKVIRQYIVEANLLNDFPVDVYDNSGALSDLEVTVILDNNRKKLNTHYTLVNINDTMVVRFNNNLLSVGQNLILKTFSSAIKNTQGYYEIASNLESNPMNQNISQFSLGEVGDHIKTITDNHPEWEGVYPGVGNLRDLGEQSRYATKFVQHSGSVALPLFYLNNKSSDVIEAIKNAQNEYGKFKRKFIQTAEVIGIDGDTRDVFDKIIFEINKDNTKSNPYYFSDMFAHGAYILTDHTVINADNPYYQLNQTFNLNEPSASSVLVYHNGSMLLYGKDYNFDNLGFVTVTKTLTLNDIISVYEYETTDGTYVPETPTKLGLYPKYEPKIYTDTTYPESKKVIQGHDGSIILAYDDYRDDLILELEKRVYNNIKVAYDESIVGINDYNPGLYRSTGITKQSIDNVLLSDFVDWLRLVGNVDYTENDTHSDTNSFTFNYSSMSAPTGELLPGFWRAVYKFAYDTDRPNVAPWEMLGFTEQPTWWENKYGPAPYTKDNLILWQDIQDGVIREPGQSAVFVKKYARPGLLNHIPVDGSGNLISPLDSNFAKQFVLEPTKNSFKFGDEGPVETAWRRSSYYPFALVSAMLLNKPAKYMGLAFDRYRIKKNSAGQFVYGDTNNRISTDRLVFGNTVNDTVRTFTAGLTNYITEYVNVVDLQNYNEYKTLVGFLEPRLTFKIRGYTSKEKFKIKLDSKTTTQSTDVFVPEEDYTIAFNSSSPIDNYTYSGLIIEKQSTGYIVRGYDKINPSFKIFPVVKTNSDPNTTVGGVSANYVEWEAEKYYTKSSYVKYNRSFYATTETHTSGQSFDNNKFIKLSSLPIEGGVTVAIRKSFYQVAQIIPYGTLFKTIQDVADFILGYDAYLKSLGFKFDNFDTRIEQVANWRLSLKEFMFWSTQNWQEGSVISLSPSATKLVLDSSYSTADNLFELRSRYEVLKEDGRKIEKENLRVVRQDNHFELITKNTVNGIYFARIPVVQKEHVCIFNNTTVFNDIIYQPEAGYRQERLKVFGYISADWNGSSSVPGFIFDKATVEEWEPYKNYPATTLIKYKQFYYTAKSKTEGTQEFDSDKWVRLDEKPQTKLIPNFDYKAIQFTDFYDLETDNFDVEQQRMSQHLLGYQPRNYLANIINDDVSQYKFYQGYIREKGTRNSLDKLFKALSSADKESVEFNEEWAIRKGQFGSSEAYQEVEFILNEKDFRLNPQPIELNEIENVNLTDLRITIPEKDVYLKSKDYNGHPFPAKFIDSSVLQSAGYVDLEDVDHSVFEYNDIKNLNADNIFAGQYIWAGYNNRLWNVYKVLNSGATTTQITLNPNNITMTLDKSIDVLNDEFVILVFADKKFICKVISNSVNTLIVELNPDVPDDETAQILTLAEARLETADQINPILYSRGLQENDVFWIDSSDNNRWAVIKNNSVYKSHQQISNTKTNNTQFGKSISANSNNTLLAISAPQESEGKIYIYEKGTENGQFSLLQIIDSPTENIFLTTSQVFDTGVEYGHTVSLSDDGLNLLVGVPNASNIRTNYKGQYDPTSSYNPDEIVQYKEQLWKSLNTIYSRDDSVDFTSFDSHTFAFESTYNPNLFRYTNIVNLVIGDHIFPNVPTNHLLIRANRDQFAGTAVGDKLQLKWNQYTTVFPNGRQPFNDAYAGANINSTFLTGEHEIVHKLEKIFVIDSTANVPELNDIVYTGSGEAKIVYIRREGIKTLIYVNQITGAFAESGELFTGVDLSVGEYQILFDDDETYNAGWWYINTPFNQTPDPQSYPTDSDVVDAQLYDVNPGLVIKDIIKNQESRSALTFVNSLDTIIAKLNTQPDHPTDASEISILTYNQEFVINGTGDVPGLKTSKLWYARATSPIVSGKAPYDSNVGETTQNTVSMWFNTIRDEQGNRFDPTTIGLSFDDLNKLQRIKDIWNGKILIQAQPDPNGNFYIPSVGDIVKDDTTNNTGEVTFVRTVGFNEVELFIKNKTGSFRLGSQYAESGTLTIIGTPNRTMGSILKTEFENQSAGSLFVFEDDNFLTPTDLSQNFYKINGKEYWLWNEIIIQGTSRIANVPSKINKDWQQVYNIQLGEGATSGGVNEGAFVSYSRKPGSNFILNGVYTVPETESNLRLGNKINFARISGQLYAYVSAQGNNQLGQFGSVHIFKLDNSQWVLAKDNNYKGPFDTNLPYYTNDIVYHEGNFYQAQTNLDINSQLTSSGWSQLDSEVDYRNVIPNTEQIIQDSSVLVTPTGDSSITQTGLLKFAKAFDVSTNGSVIVTSDEYDNGSTNVHVFRLKQGHYVYAQTLYPPQSETSYGSAVSISDDGTFIAVGSPADDTNNTDSGLVYIWKQVNGVFAISQTLRTPEAADSERFGDKLEFNGDNLVVASSKGVGAVHIFNNIDGTFLYGEKFSYYNDSTIDTFGDNFIVRKNHIILSLTDLQLTATGIGTVLDYRRGSTPSWTKIRQPHDTVDLEKIKSIFMYNKKTNRIYTTLDYIDVLQGKIAGVAEQEIYYKTPFDPAIYNTGSQGNNDETNHWMSKQVGRIWWDISRASFKYPYQNDLIYNNNNANMLFTDSTIDVYEWVESIYKPSQWDELSQGNNGASLGISGTSKYGDNAYVTYYRYDSISQTKIPVYYYWVKNRKEVPNKDGRKISADQITKIIENPKQQGIKFVQFYGPNKFGLVNCNDLLDESNTVLSFRYWTIANTNINVHTEYQLITENDGNSVPNADIEASWFNSLIGSDNFGNVVPDSNLSEKIKYGTLLRPRQSWFKNRIEALKQFVERTNGVLIDNLIVDAKDISPLLKVENAPSSNTNLFDITVDSVDDLNFIGVSSLQTAEFNVSVEDGKISAVTIINAGAGYKTVPEIEIYGKGTGAKIGCTLNSTGSITNVTVLRAGSGYSQDTTATVRDYAVLVTSDKTLGGKWAVYGYNGADWNRTLTQSVNVQLYWEYADWYATGYNQFTAIDYSVLQSYELQSLDNEIGSIVKIQTVGSGGWLLLEKIANVITDDYTQNYKTVGKQNGTIQLKSNLYDFSSTLGYESAGYDTLYYDAIPTLETRIILETIRDQLFTDELKVEYNKLFFSSLRYSLSENKINDWAIKTSFVKAKHNVGELSQKITFNNDNLSNYEDYINEVKPYKTKVREYVSNYGKVDPANIQTTDFDLAPRYNDNKQIVPLNLVVKDSVIVGSIDDTYPDKHWKDAVGFKVISISVADGGTGYGVNPEVTVTGGGGSGCQAKAVVRNGVIVRVDVIAEGDGYINSPTVSAPNFNPNGSTARLYAVLGESVVKSTHIISKFDRIARVFTDENSTKDVLTKTETFVGGTGQVSYDLKWPMDLTTGKTKITIDGLEVLNTLYTITNKLNQKTHSRYKGRITFEDAVQSGLTVEIEYNVDPKLLQAFDRIQLFYEPTAGMPGKQLSQLLDGIDYGGVEIQSLDFVNASGYEAKPYMEGAWDVYDTTFEDEKFTVDGSTTALQLSQPLEQGTTYNVYRNQTRIDDPNYPSDGSTPILNSNAIMSSIVGDGTTQIIDLLALGVPVVDGDVFEIRKSTSDGSFLADPTAYDTLLEGGNLTYTTASGTKAEDINVDGDGFITPTTSKGPEELVPGHVFDTLDIQVFDRGGETGSKISSYNEIGTGSQTEFIFQDYPQSVDAVFVTVNNALIDRNDYTVDFQNKKIIFDTAPALDSKVNFVTMSNNGEKILDIDTLLGDGCTVDFLTRATYSNDFSVYVTVNGVRQSGYTTFESDENYLDEKRVVIRFDQAPNSNDVISFVVYASSSKTFSEVTHDVLTADGSSTSYALSQTPFNATPLGHNTIVEINGSILNPGFSYEFTLTSAIEYELPNWQQVPGSAGSQDVKVYLNNEELTSTQFRWDPGNSSVSLDEGLGEIGDLLKVFVLSDGDYRIDDNGNLILNSAPAQGQQIIVTQFSNHDIQKIERINFDVVARQTIQANSEDYYTFNQLKNGRIKLRRPASDAQYVWVFVNGVKLTPSIDYKVTNDQMYIKIGTPINANDQIDLMHFSSPKFVTKFGFRQFKDMTNKTTFRRLGNDRRYYLTENLNYYDKTIQLNTTEGLAIPNTRTLEPGVLFIDGERVEYYRIDEGNKVSQLRRGTKGTGIKNIHQASTEVSDQSAYQTVPYKDQTITQVYTYDGTTSTFELGWAAKSTNEFELFVGGVRMRKNSIQSFDVTKDQDSPEADITLPAEYSVTNINDIESTFTVTNTENIPVGTKITVIRRVGRVWNEIIDENTTKTLAQTDNSIGNFLREKEVTLPQ